MNEEFNFDDMLDSYGGQESMPSNFDFGSFDFGPGAFDLPDLSQVNYGPQSFDMGSIDFGSLDAGPAAMPLSSADQAILNQFNVSMPPEKGFMDYAKEYGPYLLSPNPLASILINKLSGMVGDSIGGKEGQLAQTGTANLLSGSTPQQALANTLLSEVGGQTSQGISSLLPKSDNPSLAQEFLNRAAPNVGAQLVTALLTGNTGSLAPMVRNSLLGTGKSMVGNKVFGSLTGD